VAGDPSLRSLVDAVGALAATGERLFALVGGWAAEAAADPLTVHFATVAHELGEHAVWWREVLPESVLLEPEAALVVPPRWETALAVLGPLADDPTRTAALHLLVLPSLLVDTSAVPDGERFVRRVRDRVLADLTDAVVAGGTVVAAVCSGADVIVPGALAAALAVAPGPE